MRWTWMPVLTAFVALAWPLSASARPLKRVAGPPTIMAPRDGDVVQAVHLAGTTEPGTTVVVTEDGVALDPVASADGNWAPARAPADGSHTYSAHSADADGVASAESSQITVTVDTQAPHATISDGPSGATSDATPT